MIAVVVLDKRHYSDIVPCFTDFILHIAQIDELYTCEFLLRE
jgi:hypothetical protein